MGHLLYLIFRCDRRCDGKFGKFGNFVGTKHTPRNGWPASRPALQESESVRRRVRSQSLGRETVHHSPGLQYACMIDADSSACTIHTGCMAVDRLNLHMSISLRCVYSWICCLVSYAIVNDRHDAHVWQPCIRRLLLLLAPQLLLHEHACLPVKPLNTPCII